MSNCLLMAPLYFLLCMTKKTANELNNDLTKLIVGLINGKWILIRILANRLRTYFKSKIKSNNSYSVIFEQYSSFKNFVLEILSWKIWQAINILRTFENGSSKFQNLLPRSSLLTTYKAFVRPHHDYGHIIYDEAYNASFYQKLQIFQ